MKNTLTPVHVISGADASATVLQATPTNVLWMDDLAIQVNLSGTSIAGSLTVEASLDYAQTPFNAANAGNWATISTTAVVAAETVIVQIQPQAVPWVRIRYVPSAGTGTMNAFISGKAI